MGLGREPGAWDDGYVCCRADWASRRKVCASVESVWCRYSGGDSISILARANTRPPKQQRSWAEIHSRCSASSTRWETHSALLSSYWTVHHLSSKHRHSRLHNLTSRSAHGKRATGAPKHALHRYAPRRTPSVACSLVTTAAAPSPRLRPPFSPPSGLASRTYSHRQFNSITTPSIHPSLLSLLRPSTSSPPPPDLKHAPHRA